MRDRDVRTQTELAMEWLETTVNWFALNGWDEENGGFHEAFSPRDGEGKRRPMNEFGKRCMVQARQIAVMAKFGYVNLAEEGLAFLRAHYRREDGAYRHKIGGQSQAATDNMVDLYDQAFVLFALAQMHDKLHADMIESEAQQLADYIEKNMAHEAGGYVENLNIPKTPMRRQNPHMHLLEAYLAWYGQTGSLLWLMRAQTITHLLLDKFIVEGTLREFFEEDLTPKHGRQGELVEPGHCFEWVALISEFLDSANSIGPGWRIKSPTLNQLQIARKRMYDFACIFGTGPSNCLTHGLIDKDGDLIDPEQRLWPQCEAIKAHVAMAETSDVAAPQRLSITLPMLLRDFLREPPSWWESIIPPKMTPMRRDLPASSLYHIAFAIRALQEHVFTTGNRL